MRYKIVLLIFFIISVCKLNAQNNYKTFIYGVAYYPEHWPASYWEQDAKRMQECGVNTVRIGEFAWYYFEPEEGKFQFDLFDKAIETLAKYGIKTIIGTPTAAPPKWLTEKYPSVLAKDFMGNIRNDQSRQHTTYNSSIYRQFSKKITEALVLHYKNNPNVIGWQTDNELNCHISEFYGDDDQKEFREWLKNKYQNLDSLNERWGNRFWSQWYTNWNQISLPTLASAYHNPAMMLDHKRFISYSVIRFQKEQIEIIRKNCPTHFITHNGTFRYIDYYEFSKDLDIYAHDNYPCFMSDPRYVAANACNISRGFKGNFMIMEQQTGAGGQAYLLRSPEPGEMSLWAFQAIAYGADGMSHFRWRTAHKGAEEYWLGVLDYDNVPRGRYEEFKKEGAQIKKIAPEIFQSKIVSDIAVLKDFEAEWVYNYQFLTKEINIAQTYIDFTKAASDLKYNIDFIDINASFDSYKIVFAPYMIMMDPVLADRIKQFVAKGGIFITSAHSCVKDRDNGMTWNTIPIHTTDLFGMEIDMYQCYEQPSITKNTIRFQSGDTASVNVFADVLKLKTAKSIAVWTKDFMKGSAACTENSFQKGKAVYYATFFNYSSAYYLINKYAIELGIQPILKNVSQKLEVTKRTKGNTNYYFILNHSDVPVDCSIGTGYYDLIEGKEFPSKYTFKAFEYKVLKK